MEKGFTDFWNTPCKGTELSKRFWGSFKWLRVIRGSGKEVQRTLREEGWCISILTFGSVISDLVWLRTKKLRSNIQINFIPPLDWHHLVVSYEPTKLGQTQDWQVESFCSFSKCIGQWGCWCVGQVACEKEQRDTLSLSLSVVGMELGTRRGAESQHDKNNHA